MNDAPLPEDADDELLQRRLRDSRQLEDAPEHLIQRAIDLWQPRAAATTAAAAGGALRRWIATLRFDSAASDNLALGLRASGASTTRQMLFSAEGRDIDLRLEPLADRRWRISGQVLGPDAAGIAELCCGDAAPQQVAWNELCEFEFEPVATGVCALTLRADGWEISVPSFDLARGP
jgi:hypothetical protein